MAAIIKLELTVKEWSVLNQVVSSVMECLEWDESTESYTDGERFILSLDEEGYKMLNKIKNKLL